MVCSLGLGDGWGSDSRSYVSSGGSPSHSQTEGVKGRASEGIRVLSLYLQLNRQLSDHLPKIRGGGDNAK